MTTHWLSIIAPSIAAGNALAGSFSDNPADVNAFDYSTRLYPPGTTFGPPAGPLQPREASNPPSAYYLGVAISDAKYAQAQAMLAAVLAQGFKIDLGDRATVEPRWAQFIAGNGYVMP